MSAPVVSAAWSIRSSQSGEAISSSSIIRKLTASGKDLQRGLEGGVDGVDIALARLDHAEAMKAAYAGIRRRPGRSRSSLHRSRRQRPQSASPYAGPRAIAASSASGPAGESWGYTRRYRRRYRARARQPPLRDRRAFHQQPVPVQSSPCCRFAKEPSRSGIAFPIRTRACRNDRRHYRVQAIRTQCCNIGSSRQRRRREASRRLMTRAINRG